VRAVEPADVGKKVYLVGRGHVAFRTRSAANAAADFAEASATEESRQRRPSVDSYTLRSPAKASDPKG